MNDDDGCDAMANTPLCVRVCVEYIDRVKLLVKQFSLGYFFPLVEYMEMCTLYNVHII